jgi:hypothetical protein
MHTVTQAPFSQVLLFVHSPHNPPQPSGPQVLPTHEGVQLTHMPNSAAHAPDTAFVKHSNVGWLLAQTF